MLATDIEDIVNRNNKLISIVFDMNLLEVEHLPIGKYIDLVKELNFLSTPLTDKPVPFVTANKRKYKFIWDVMQIRAGRYIEIKHFGGDIIQNMHQLFASMVIPMKKKWYGWVEDKYDASKHQEYSNDMLYANIEEVYGCVVFFYHVYRNWIEVSEGYLRSKQKSKGEELGIVTFKEFMDGSIVPRLLPTTKILDLRRHINYQ
jgi:hypothetical protein